LNEWSATRRYSMSKYYFAEFVRVQYTYIEYILTYFHKNTDQLRTINITIKFCVKNTWEDQIFMTFKTRMLCQKTLNLWEHFILFAYWFENFFLFRSIQTNDIVYGVWTLVSTMRPLFYHFYKIIYNNVFVIILLFYYWFFYFKLLRVFFCFFFLLLSFLIEVFI
jgi:hypothetical protein